MNSAPSQEPGCVPVLDDAMESHAGAASWGVQRMKNRIRATLVELASQRSMNFAFVDQVLVSGSNFVAGILLARAFGIFEFGRFALAWMFVEFIGSLQFAAIIQPMLNIGPKQAEADSDRYYGALIAQQAAACMVFGVAAWLSATVAGWLLSDPEFNRLALPLCAAIMGYQLQCFFRRYFFARDRPVAGLFNDALRFAIQIAATAALAFGWPGSTAGAGQFRSGSGCSRRTCRRAHRITPQHRQAGASDGDSGHDHGSPDQYKPGIPRASALQRAFCEHRAARGMAMRSRIRFCDLHRSGHLGGSPRTAKNHLFFLRRGRCLYRHRSLSLDPLWRPRRRRGRLVPGGDHSGRSASGRIRPLEQS